MRLLVAQAKYFLSWGDVLFVLVESMGLGDGAFCLGEATFCLGECPFCLGGCNVCIVWCPFLSW